MLRHPAPYVKGCLERLRYALRLQPLLWAAALVVLGLNFRSESFRQVGLFCCYFAGVHCLLSIEKRYLEPLWMILGALTVTPVSLNPGAATGRFARAVTGATQNAREYVGHPVDHIGVVVATLAD